jgi:Holliday junction resolvasome RuvABC ATP-dependent DNA helicase subunit
MNEDRSKYKKFIQYLDEHKHKRDFNKPEVLSVLQNSHLNFVNNEYHHKKYMGDFPFSNSAASFYNIFNITPTQDDNFIIPLIPRPDYYEYWKQKHEANPFLIIEKPIVEKVNKKTIECSVETFSDILNIINNNEYREDTEYNIDLKSLFQIKEELLQLDAMIGIVNFKNAILDQLLYFIQNLHAGKDSDFKNTILCGPPGTGKTEIATILGKMYSKLGILKNNTFKKVTRSDLVAGYLGQTAIKTKKVITECLGGCLFIDEAYSLANGDREDSYSKECLDTLCESMSEHKEDLMVIIAGYEDELNDTFFRANKGLESRFIWRFKLDDYSSEELMQIFLKKVTNNAWEFDLSNSESGTLKKWFESKKETFKHFGRDMELLFSYTKIAHGRRIYGKSQDIRKKLNLEDLNRGYDVFLSNLKKKEVRSIPYGLYT